MGTDKRRASRQAEAERNDQALLAAAREVLAIDGAHASVASIAAAAGVGIGSLYRRYRTKEELYQRLCEIALDDYARAAEEGLAHGDPWEGLVHYITTAVSFGPGSLAPIAGTIEITAEMAEKNERSDRAVEMLVGRAHRCGALRNDATALDISLLIEQLAKSPLDDHFKRQQMAALAQAARTARERIVAIAIQGLRAPAHQPLPGDPPGYELFSERWASRHDNPSP
ncbi:TetR/AcrR family transcriptional regulator [Phytoactinopolyspora alkaliphila]|uniref:TetR/AcrR family transcriptional regulator n=1 Tax=Phytoactinopolyspora alkaliphila TaxID=1783498 RepID=UPI001C205C42